MPFLEDYASIIQAGQNLQPDLQAELARRQENELRRQEIDLRRQQQVAAIGEAQRKQERQQAFRARLQQVTAAGGNPRAIYQLMIEFPEFADQLKEGAKGLSDEAKNANLVRGGAIYARASAGDYEGAAKAMEARIAADRAAGNDVSEDEAIVAALRSGDPTQQKVALSTLGIGLAAMAGPEKFAEAYGKLNSEEKQSPFMREYNDRVKQFGKAAADAWAATESDKFVSVDGVGVFRGSDLTGAGSLIGNPTQPGGGDPADPRRGVPAPQTGANGIPATLTPEQYDATVAAMGKAQTDAWMQQNGVTVSGSAQQTARMVRSKQEYDRLPSGTEYVAPDGSRRRKP